MSSKQKNTASKSKPQPIDLYRESNLRYLGYAHVIGSALRPIVNSIFINVSYAISISYICADLFDKTSKLGGDADKINHTGGDVLIWQSFASMILPGVAMNQLKYYSCRLFRKARMNRNVIRYGPVVIGLAAIPLMVTPIDVLTDDVMNHTYRKWLHEEK